MNQLANIRNAGRSVLSRGKFLWEFREILRTKHATAARSEIFTNLPLSNKKHCKAFYFGRLNSTEYQYICMHFSQAEQLSFELYRYQFFV